MKKPGLITLGAWLLALSLTVGCTSKQAEPNWGWINSLPKPWTLKPEEFSQYLQAFHQHFPDFQDRLKAIALWRVGTPYSIFKLGEEAPPDPDPIIRFDVSDCTGHVLTSLAATEANSWQEARRAMEIIHYKPDSTGRHTPSYYRRWHFTTDRILHNPFTTDITTTLFPKSELDSVQLVLNRKENGQEFLPLDWEEPVTVYYIPNRLINEQLLARLPQVVGVAFVKPSYFKLGVVIGHEGMIIDGRYLIHASQSAGKTVKVDFLKYYFPESGPLFGGIMLYTFHEEPFSNQKS